ncbi:hypothetical protein ACJ41O_005945 [Fusarium nematophilum]
MAILERFDLVIVGAGWHGLAMAKTYREAHSEANILILDYAESVGGTWANERLYPGLKTNNLVGTYEFSDFPLVPEKYGIEPGQHIPGHVVYRYLCDFCDSFGLTSMVRLRTKVESATLLPNGDWQVSTQTVEVFTSGETTVNDELSKRGVIVTPRLVLATGLTSEPFMPALPGQEIFKGQIFHAKDFKARAKDLAGAQTVVAIGGNKSAWDVCYTSWVRFGAKAHMVMRRSGGGPGWCWPARMKGYLVSISAVSATRLFSWLDPNPYGQSAWPIRALVNRTWLGRKLSELFWRHLDDKVTRLNAYDDSPGTAILKPWSSTFWMGNSLSIHNYESSWFDLAKHGQITAHAAEVSRLSETAVHLSDGTVIEADALICCTGWETKPNIQFFPDGLADRLGFPGPESGNQALEAKAKAEILRAAPVLRSQPARQLPATFSPEHVKLASTAPVSYKTATPSSPFRLYRFMLPCDADIIRRQNFAVIGAHITLHTVILAQTQALWITAFFDNKIPQLATSSQQVPNLDEIQRDTFYHTEYQRLRRPKETGGMGDRCPDLVFDSIPYVDLLLSDLNLRRYRKPSWYREITEPYRLCDFEGLVEEWRSGMSVVATSTAAFNDSPISPVPSIPTRTNYPNPGYLGASSHVAIFSQLSEDEVPLQYSSPIAADPVQVPAPESLLGFDGEMHATKVAECMRRLLGSFPSAPSTFKDLVAFWRATGANLALAEPMVDLCRHALDDLHSLSTRSGTDQYVTYARMLLRNSSRPLAIQLPLTLEEFCSQSLGSHTRLEILGLLICAVIRATSEVHTFPSLYLDGTRRQELMTLAVKLTDVAVEAILSLDMLNDLQLIFQYENFISHSYVFGVQSYHSYRKLGDVITSIVTLGYHEKLGAASASPLFLVDMRRTALARAYSADKNWAIFLGRPPRLGKKFCHLNAALRQSISVDEEAHSPLAHQGNTLYWSTDSKLSIWAETRWTAACASLKEEILEMFNEQKRDNFQERVCNLQQRTEKQWAALPGTFRMEGSLKNYERGAWERDFLVSTRLGYLHVLFLLRLLCMGSPADPDGAFVGLSQEILSLVVEIIVLRNQLLAHYGLPAIGIIMIAMLRRNMPRDGLQDAKVIRDLGIVVTEVDLGTIVRPTEPNYALLSRATDTIKKFLIRFHTRDMEYDRGRGLDITRTMPDSWDLQSQLEPWDFEIDFWNSLAEHPSMFNPL